MLVSHKLCAVFAVVVVAVLFFFVSVSMTHNDKHTRVLLMNFESLPDTEPTNRTSAHHLNVCVCVCKSVKWTGKTRGVYVCVYF